MNKTMKNIFSELGKGLLYAVLGVIFGILTASSLQTVAKVLCLIGIVFILVLISVVFALFSNKKEPTVTSRMNSLEQSARISRGGASASVRPETNFSEAPQQSQMQSQAQQQGNPLDRKPMSAEKKEQRTRNKTRASKIVLLNEEGKSLMEWSLDRQTSLIIGKGSDKEPVDIDLAGSAVAQMISKQHAVLNYTEKGWYIDDIDSKNGTRVKKTSQNSIMDVKLVGAIEVEPGDIIYIASTMLQLQ